MSIKFYLPDFVDHLELNILLYEVMKTNPEYFWPDISIGAVYGTFPTSLWNGGRTFGGGTLDRNFMEEIIKQFNSRGIPCRFTFTNPHINEGHLKDSFCNMCLKMGDNGMNEVVVVSPILEAYIREKFPKYRIISSICKRIEDIEGIKEELEKDYSLVVIDYNWNNRFEELSKIPYKDHCEFLLDSCCVPNCKRRKDHFNYIGEYQIAITQHMRKSPNKPFEFEDFTCDRVTPYFYDTIKLTTHITPKDLYEKYVPMGFEHFKLEGRGQPDYNVLESYIYYMVKPEYKDQARLQMLLLLSNATITEE